jgi:hypothetical protein
VSPREVLLKAAKTASRQRGAWRCVFTCIYDAANDDETARHLAREQFKRHLSIASIVTWNDARGRSKADVVTALLGAAGMVAS